MWGSGLLLEALKLQMQSKIFLGGEEGFCSNWGLKKEHNW